jgi:hypothetical protein
VPADADEGNVISVSATRSDAKGTITSDLTGTVIYPALTGTITINGDTIVGETLTADISNLGGSGTISYQWLRGGSIITGSTNDSYTLTSADVGYAVSVRVTRLKNTSSVTSASTAQVIWPSLTGAAQIGGTAQVGQTLTAVTTNLNGSGMIQYQWLRNNSITIGTDSATYVPVIADANATISVRLTRSENSGSVTSAATSVVIYAQLTGAVTITGAVQVGQTLTCNTTNLGGSGTISYQWLRDGTTNIGSNSRTYVPVAGDVGNQISVCVSRAQNIGNVTSALTAAVIYPSLTGTVSIQGSTYLGQTLTAITTSLGGSGTINYQWLRDGIAINGATSSSYTLAEADLGCVITVRVSRNGYNGTVVSTETGEVKQLPDFPSLEDFFSYLEINATDGDSYMYELVLDETLSPKILSYSGKKVDITLRGRSINRIITITSVGTLFTIEEGVSLILENNVTLVGKNNNNASLIVLRDGGTLNLYGNSAISGNKFTSTSTNPTGGGVFINKGILNMRGSSSIFNNHVDGGYGSETNRRSAGGGGVYINDGVLNMYDNSSVIGNSASAGGYSPGAGGGGINVALGSLNIYDDAIIAGNTAQCYSVINPDRWSASGGGIGLNSGAVFRKNGGRIAGETTNFAGFEPNSLGGYVNGHTRGCALVSGTSITIGEITGTEFNDDLDETENTE